MKNRHNENAEMTVCRFCDKVFLDVSQKPGHIATTHSGEFPAFFFSYYQAHRKVSNIGWAGHTPKGTQILGEHICASLILPVLLI